MDYKITVVKALKAVLFVLLGSIAAAFATPDFVASVQEAVKAALSAIPVVGGVLTPAASSLALGLFTALVVAIENVRKNISR